MSWGCFSLRAPYLPVPPGRLLPEGTIFFVDLRPILQGFQSRYASRGKVDLQTLEQQFADGLPADHTVLIHGGRTELEGNATVLYIQEREVLRVEFCRDDHERPPSGETSEADSSSSSSSSSGGSGDETRAPSLIPGAAVSPVAKSRPGNGRRNLKRPVPGSDAVGSCLSLCLVHPTGTIAASANDLWYGGMNGIEGLGAASCALALGFLLTFGLIDLYRHSVCRRLVHFQMAHSLGCGLCLCLIGACFCYTFACDAAYSVSFWTSWVTACIICTGAVWKVSCCDGPIIIKLSKWGWRPSVSARLLCEPGCRGPAERRSLDNLRRVTTDMGGAWPYFQLAGRNPQQTLQDMQDAPETAEEAEADIGANFTALAPGYQPETCTVQLRMPATYAEAVAAFHEARSPRQARAFPHLLDASPQPCLGHGVFVCCPHWLGVSLVICLDLLQLDGRLLAVRAPPYCSKHRLLQLAALPTDEEVVVYVGPYEDPLQDGIDVRLFPGETIRYLRAGGFPAAPISLTQMLLDVALWRGQPQLPEVDSAEIYGVATDMSCSALRLSDPASWRRDIAALMHIPVFRLRVFLSAPRVEDASIKGYPCHTVVVAAADEPPFRGRIWHAAILDGRVILDDWMPLYIVDGSMLSDDLLHGLQQSAPAGWLPRLSVDATPDGLLVLREGQVVAVDYYPDMPSALGPSSDSIPQAVFGIAQLPAQAQPHDLAGSSGQFRDVNDRSRGFEATFAVYVPDKIPLYLDVRLTAGTAVEAALQSLNSMRGHSERALFPGLLVVTPQPDPTYGTLLAVPRWSPPGVFVFFDCRQYDDRAFAALVPHGMDRAGISKSRE